MEKWFWVALKANLFLMKSKITSTSKLPFYLKVSTMKNQSILQFRILLRLNRKSIRSISTEALWNRKESTISVNKKRRLSKLQEKKICNLLQKKKFTSTERPTRSSKHKNKDYCVFRSNTMICWFLKFKAIEKRKDKKPKFKQKQRNNSRLSKTIGSRRSNNSEELSIDWKQDIKISQLNNFSSLNIKNSERQ